MSIRGLQPQNQTNVFRGTHGCCERGRRLSNEGDIAVVTSLPPSSPWYMAARRPRRRVQASCRDSSKAIVLIAKARPSRRRGISEFGKPPRGAPLHDAPQHHRKLPKPVIAAIPAPRSAAVSKTALVCTTAWPFPQRKSACRKWPLASCPVQAAPSACRALSASRRRSR